ncbi:hypothetical protein ACLMJK_002850 [Lecanora helva]
MHPSRLLLFGDQTVEKLDAIRKLVNQSKTTPTLKRFLQESADVVQKEVGNLPAEEQAAFYDFDELLALAEQNAAEETPNETCATTLMCIARIGETILYEENNPGLLMAMGSTLHVLGLCTGLLPAAAAIMSSSLTDLLNYGREVVAMSVRMGYEITTRSRNADNTPGSWAYSIIGVTASEIESALASFYKTQNIPLYKRAYVAVTSRTWTTLFGPPSTFARIWQECPQLGLAPKLKLIAAGGVHAPDLPPLDVKKILGQSDLLSVAPPRNTRCISSNTCKPYVAADFRALLELMLDDIMKNPLRLTETVQKVVSELRGQRVDLFVSGPTAHTNLMQEALQGAQCSVNVVRSAETPSVARPSREGSNLVAIVGMSGRFPGSETLQEFWKVISRGQDLSEKIPSSRFDYNSYLDADGATRNSISTAYGCFLQNPGLFDNRFFNISPREAAQMDPMQRLLLMTTYEAMEMAGYSPGGSLSTTAARISTYFGQATDDWRQNNESSTQGIDVYFIPGITRAFYPGRLNYHFKWEGGSYSLDAACASSSTAVHLACASLLSRESDTAIAGGANILTSPSIFAGLSRGKFLSKTGNCKAFAADADGYCRAEGTGVVVLKRLEDALAENDNILAVVNGSGRTYSADAPSITQPFAPAQKKLYRRVLRKAGVDPLDVGYVEMHGTGTQAGDPVETESVAEVFCKDRTKDNPLHIGAIKANVGHGEAERRIPPHPRAPLKLNPKFPPLEKLNMKVPDKELTFEIRPKKGDKRRIFLNNFDASGGNTCLLIEEHPLQKSKGHDPRSYHIVTCSARTSKSLSSNKARLRDYLRGHRRLKLQDLAYTTTARRMHHDFRSSFAVHSTEQLIENLGADVTKSPGPDGFSSVVFAFTGQGSTYAGMGQQLFQTCARFRESILKYQQICDLLGLPAVTPLISNTGMKEATTTQTQLAIVFLELALADLWKSWGVQPQLLIGHSLGEYSALCVSGVLSVTDTLNLVGIRSTLLERKCKPSTFAMLAVNDSWHNVERACKDTSCRISCNNAPTQTVVSGLKDDLKQLESHFSTAGIKTTYLQIPYGFHSAQITPILAEFEESARAMQFSKPKTPVASTLLGQVIGEAGTFSPKYLARQAREPVDFLGALHACNADDRSVWVEIGPEAFCLGMIRTTLSVSSSRLLASMKSSEENWKTLSTSLSLAYLAKLPLLWNAYHREYLDALTLLDIPSYAFDMKDYWSLYNQELLGTAVSKGSTASMGKPQLPTSQLTTCLQYVVEESVKQDHGSVTFVSYTSEPKLHGIIQGHLVDDVALCPASVFCDMAFTAAKYVYSKVQNADLQATMSLEGLEMHHPIIVSKIDPSQKIEVKATKPANDSFVSIAFSTSSDDGSFHETGACRVRFDPNNEWRKGYSRTLPLVRKRADSIRQSALAGHSHRLLKPIVYKLFSTLVSYGQNYQGIEEAFLDNGCRESTARIQLRPCPNAGDFTRNPYWLDNLVHLSGFVLNGDSAKPNDIAFIATGMEALHVIKELSDSEEYECYVTIQDSPDNTNVLMGDAYVFNGDELVVLCAGMCFQRMHKIILATILGKNVTPTQSHSKPTAPQHQLEKPAVALIQAGNARNSKIPAKQEGERKSGEADRLLSIILSESGFSADDVDLSTPFSDMGVDSLMSVTIISAAKKELGMDLPASFFMNNPTVKDMRQALEGEADLEDDTALSSSSEAMSTAPESLTEASSIDESNDRKNDTGATPPSEISQPSEPEHILQSERQEQEPRVHKSNVVLLQGRNSSKEHPLFLVTDGAGSATAYLHIPPLPNGRRMYALESPYLSDPLAFTCSVEEFCKLYVAAIQEKQPKGPYYLGGWSAGAVYSYETARQLSNKGEKIQFLFLIDMRVPRPMTDALEPTLELIEQAGLVTGIKRTGQIMTEASTLLKQHLVSTVRSLTRFQPQPMDPDHRPAHAFMVWAKKGISDENSAMIKGFDKEELDAQTADRNVMEDEKTGLKGWFFAKRKVFGPNGWDEMVGDVECHTMDADHFSMVQPPEVRHLGKILQAAIKKAQI